MQGKGFDGMGSAAKRRNTVQSVKVPLENNSQWLSKDLDNKIKHYDEIRQFIMDDLDNQMASLNPSSPIKDSLKQ